MPAAGLDVSRANRFGTAWHNQWSATETALTLLQGVRRNDSP